MAVFHLLETSQCCRKGFKKKKKDKAKGFLVPCSIRVLYNMYVWVPLPAAVMLLNALM